MVHYAVTVDGRVIGSRSSKSHAVQIYRAAVIVVDLADGTAPIVSSYHGSEALAGAGGHNQAAAIARYHGGGSIRIVPVATTARRAKIGEGLAAVPVVL